METKETKTYHYEIAGGNPFDDTLPKYKEVEHRMDNLGDMWYKLEEINGREIIYLKEHQLLGRYVKIDD